MSLLEARLLRQIARANQDFQLIEPGARVMVALSGGKDSWCLLHLLRLYRRKLPFEFDLVSVTLDQGHPGFPADTLRDYLTREGYEHRIVYQDTYSVVQEKTPEGKTTCSLCSRLRRGALYHAAVELGATRVALGHHRDDAIETLLLNLFFAGQMKAMPARLQSDDGRNTIIRPLIYCAEAELAEYATAVGFPIIPCDLCGSQENLQRKQMKQLLNTLEAGNPRVRGNLLAALGNVVPSHLLDLRLRTTDNPDAEPLVTVLEPEG